jgi:hypothetical protein
MKKVIYGIAFCLLILSCEIPESLTLKGNPGLYVPLGSPFTNMKEGERLEDLISPDNIRKSMNSNASDDGEDNGLIIYDVSEAMAVSHGIDPTVQTYLVQYPLTEMPLNLEKYLNQSMEDSNDKEDVIIPDIPAVTGPLPPETYYYIYGDKTAPSTSEIPEKPFFRVSLNDMARLVKKIKRDSGDRFGLEISYSLQLAQYLEFKIPAFGINTYIKGTPDPSVNPEKLLFFDDSGNDFTPRDDLHKSGDDSELWVYARISGPCFGKIEPELLFEWKKAVIKTDNDGDDAFKTEYPIENSLGDFLGGGVSFNRVDGYVYMTDLNSPEPVVMTVDIKGDIQTRNLQDATPSFTVTEKSDGTLVAHGSLTNSSFTGPNPTTPLDLRALFQDEGAVLKVNVEIEEMEITYSEDLSDKSIKFSLYVLIPMNLKIEEVADKEAPNVTVGGVNIRNTYVPLDLGDKLAKLGEGDLFGRKDDEDNLLNEINFVEIFLKEVNITITEKDKLMLLVKNKDDYKLLEFKDRESLKYEGDLLSKPFSPEFSVLLKKDTATSGSFNVLRTDNPKFDFKLDVNAKAKVDYTIKF